MASRAAVILLAAGMSRRMGSPKALLKIGEETLLQIALEAMNAALSCESVIVASALVAKAVRDRKGIRIVRNDEPDRGQLHSLQLALRALSEPGCEGAAVLLLDNPEDARSRLRCVLDAAAQQPSAVIAAAWRGERGHPIYLPKRLWNGILSFEGEGGLRGFLDSASESVILVETTEAALIDIDTPRDYEGLTKRQP
ncbi:hypothetical protein BH09SUM1_BH09SUM1_26820 [soil metagenome]